MGTFMVDMEIGDPSGKRYVPFSGIVGRKSTFTALPTSLLESLGVTPTSTATFERVRWADIQAPLRLHAVALRRRGSDRAGGIRR